MKKCCQKWKAGKKKLVVWYIESGKLRQRKANDDKIKIRQKKPSFINQWNKIFELKKISFSNCKETTNCLSKYSSTKNNKNLRLTV